MRYLAKPKCVGCDCMDTELDSFGYCAGCYAELFCQECSEKLSVDDGTCPACQLAEDEDPI